MSRFLRCLAPALAISLSLAACVGEVPPADDTTGSSQTASNLEVDDTDGDGIPDGVDLDCDGTADLVFDDLIDLPDPPDVCIPGLIDDDGDGIPDGIDLDCDGVIDLGV